jgi:hypothetical protein
VGLFVLLVIGFLSMVAVGVLAELTAPACVPNSGEPICHTDRRTTVTFLPAIGFGTGLLIAALGGGRAAHQRRSPGPWLFVPILLGGISVAVSLFLVFES